MRTETHTVCIGEDMGPIDWEHPTASGMPQTWRDAEKTPDAFNFNGRRLIKLCMYDGWPYWKPTPAVLFAGVLGPEWDFFNSYGVEPSSIQSRPVALSLTKEGGDHE